MPRFKVENIKKIVQKLAIPKPWDSIIILLLVVLIEIPGFIILHQNIIDPDWPFHLDRILIFIAILLGLFFLLRAVKRVLLFAIAIYLMLLGYGTLIGNYGFSNIYEDYRSMIYSMQDNPYPQDVIISRLLPFPNKNKILKAVEFTNPGVRNFAVSATTKHFSNLKGYRENRKMIQCFAVFKEVNEKWNYVNDPIGQEYIAAASESLEHFSGDCDDHAIFMSACIKAIGGTPRIIHTQGHMYPEMLIGSKADLETAIYLIKEVLFEKEAKNKQIFYHIDERDQVWLNLDYTARYPGGPFMSKEILGELTIN
ncbi:transglutaminase [Flavobacterium agricola]|uniref:Transglutaminase n=1 Tax=Flavobacterium agricola TaxID=2870839 RepID=A0ABY6M0H6_9FLAO|nr:transglutaminase [Flavobacterium agricola]UYW02058.1 transglutaminase [Flavobacterium agricola]